MTTRNFNPLHEDMPDTIPIFPLDGVLLLPRGHLPLNIFEPRYVAMVDDALRSHRMIGMIQPNTSPAPDSPALFKTGCAGRIVQFQEADNGRYLITLRGVSRFDVVSELKTTTLYRQVQAKWNNFGEDYELVEDLGVDRARLVTLLDQYFTIHDMTIDWKLITAVNDEKLMTCLAMICPFSSCEKQALLEAPTCLERAAIFMNLLEISVRSGATASQH